MKNRNMISILLLVLSVAAVISFSVIAFSGEAETAERVATSGEQIEDGIDAENGAENGAEEMQQIVQHRETIISMVEDDFSAAYSFDSSSEYPIPHYEKLDRLFPMWHHGEPAAARQFWLTLDFHAQFVQYRVDYVYMVNDVTAVVGGKRLVVWTRSKDSSIIEKGYWPFQYWSNLTRHANDKCVKCIDVTYAVGYSMKLKLSERGAWSVISEELYDQPGIPNTWEEDCKMEKFLKDWGFNSTCGEEKMSLFGQ